MSVSLVLLTLAAASAAKPHAQIYANSGLFGGRDFNLGLDLPLAQKLSAGPYFATGGSRDSAGELSFKGVGARVDYHFAGVMQTGWYVSPFISRYTMDLRVDGEKEDQFTAGRIEFAALNGGATGGYAWYYGDSVRFMIRLGLGAMYSSISGQTELTTKDGERRETDYSTMNGWLPTADLHLGIAF